MPNWVGKLLYQIKDNDISQLETVLLFSQKVIQYSKTNSQKPLLIILVNVLHQVDPKVWKGKTLPVWVCTLRYSLHLKVENVDLTFLRPLFW